MQEIQTETCIEFKERTTETAYMSIKNDNADCWAIAGYQGKKQAVNMGPDCFGSDVILIYC